MKTVRPDKCIKCSWLSRTLILALFASSSFVSSGAMADQLKAANGATTIVTAPNGVPVVNIANPNSAGLSNNLFTDYNVDSKGVVLNNGDTSQLQRQSQLAGAVSANTNLTSEATLILNQVVSTNRSVLSGYTEVLGGAADVVVANPNGITCSGCGFINTPHATLTTGAPVFNGSGGLSGFNVNAGDILITGAGLDASTTDYVALFARSLVIQGQINAKYLDIVAGANNIDYTTKAVTPHAATGTAPTLAIDSSVMGGMYANRIRLVATEAGVGVRMLGDAAAGVGDFTLTSSGKVELGNHISAQGNLQVTSADTSAADSIKVTDAILASGGAMTLTATGGNIHLIGGLLASQDALTLQSATLTDEFDINSITNNNERFAAGVLMLSQTGAVTLDGTIYDATGALGITADSLSIGADSEALFGGTLTATTAGNLSLANAALQSQGDISLTSTAGQISTAAASGEGIESSAGNISLSAATGINNAGAVSADTGSLVVNTDGSLTNSGSFYARLTGVFADLLGAGSESVTNSGTIVVDGGLNMTGGALTNQGSGGIQGTAGSTFTLSSLTNNGVIIGSANDADAATINTGTLTNGSTGIIQSAQDLTLNATGNVTNSNNILASGNLLISAAALTNNSNSTLQGTTGSTFTLASLDNFGTLTGATNGGGTATINADTLTNESTGIIQSAHDLILNVKTSLVNSFDILAARNLTVDARTTGTTLAITNNQANGITGVLQAGTGILAIAGTSGGSNATIGTQNGYLIGHDLAFNLSALTNSGTIQGGLGNSNITVVNTLTNNLGGLISISQGGSSQGNVTASIITNGGTFQSGGNMTLNATDTLTNNGTGVIQSESDVTLNAGKILTNNFEIVALGDVNITSVSNANTLVITNASTGIIQSTNGFVNITGDNSVDNNVTLNTQNGIFIGWGLNFNVSSLINSGTLQGGLMSGTNITATTLTNNASGVINLASAIFSGGAITSSNLTNNGTLESDGSMTLNLGTSTLTDAAGKKIVAAKDLNITAGSLAFGSTSSAIIAGQSGSGTGTITLSNNLTNIGLLFSGGNLTVSAPHIVNTATGGIAANGTLNVNSTGLSNANLTCGGPITLAGIINCGGSLYAGSSLNISGAPYDFTPGQDNTVAYKGDFVNEAGGAVNSSGDITINTADFTNYNNIEANGNITINTGNHVRPNANGEFDNEISGTTPANIIAGNTLTIENFFDGVNDGSNLIGQTVTLDTNGDTFINQAAGGHTGTIRATTFNADGFTLTNSGSPTGATVSTTTNSSTLSGDASAVTNTPANGVSSVSGTSPVNNTSTITLNGISIQLPTNPNGEFITNPNPNIGPLIETNPLYAVGSDFLGSDYMEKTYGVDPDKIERSLGDANYEASLIKQQVSAAGAIALLGTTNQAAAMQQLMTNGDTVGKALGLKMGVAPTASQIANLSTDMVWMVDTVVDGQHVLAPVVYLSAATKSQITSGAVIEATNANMNLSSLNNNGGLIAVSNNLNITTFDNLTNTSGTITGGNISLSSLSGNIINQTQAITTGGPGNMQTAIGATGLISATNNLSLNAANSINNLGATMSAGNNASLVAGNNINFDTVLNKQSSTSGRSTTTTITNLQSALNVGGSLLSSSGNDTTFAGTNVGIGGSADIGTGGNLNIIARNDSTSTTSTSSSGNIFSGKSTTSTSTQTTNVGSNFTVGGNLNSASGRDTTIQGSNVNVAGNGAVTAGGNLNILDGQNTSATSTSTTKTGLGVGGGVYGTQNTTNTDVTGTSVASNLNFGGNANLSAGNGLTMQGSNLATGGNLGLNAQSIDILAGRNTDVSTSTTDTTSFLSMGNNSASGSTGANTNYTPTQQQAGMGQAQAQAAGANASAGESATGAGLTLSNHTTTSAVNSSSTAVGSSIKAHGNLSMNSAGDTTLEGANVSAGGNANLSAGGNLNIGAAQNTHTVTTSKDSASVGFFTSSQNDASSGANAGYANNGTGASSDMTATGTAGGKATSKNRLDLAQVDQSGTTTTDITHTGTTITSGGNTGLDAKKDINIAGSSVNAAGNLSANAGNNLNVTAVQDSHTVQTNKSDTAAGLYANGEADASATANGDSGSKYGGLGMQGTGTATANANAGVGLEGTNTTSSSTSGYTTALTSALTSGGDMTRTAGGALTDQGTNISAGGSLTQNAASWISTAAQNTTFSNTGSATNTAELGLYAGANATKTANYNQNSTTAGQDPSASAGLSASYERDTSGSSSATSTAVVSNIHTGGGFSSTTTGATALQGTKVNAGGDVNLNASSLNYTAAQNTSTSSNSNGQINAGLQVGKGTSGYSAALNGGANELGTNNASTTAVVGSLTSGGNLNVNTTGDTTFEGTNLSAGKSATVQSTGGNVTFNAAHDTASSSENYQGFTASISGNEKDGALAFNGGQNGESSASSTAVTSTVSAGNGLTVKANNALTMQGTNLNAGGDVTLGANTLDYQAAQNTSSNSQASQTLDVAASGKSDGSAAAFAGGYVNTDTSGSSSTAVVGNVKAGGNLNINTTGDQTYTGTNLSAGKDANISSTAGGVNFNQAQNSTSSSSTQWGVSGSASTSQGSDGGTTQKAAAGGGYQTNSAATTTGIAGNIKTGGTLDVTSSKDLTLQGTNIASGGDTSLQSTGGSVNYQAATSTATGSGWGVNAQLSGSDSSSGSSPSSSKGGQIGGNYSSQNDVTQTAGKITSGGGVAIKGDQDVTLVGTNVTSTGKTTVAAANGNVNIDTATSTKDDQGYAAAIGVKNTSSGSGSAATSKNGYAGGVDVNVDESTTRTGASFNGSALDISSGKDANLTGTKINTTGDTSLSAGGNLNLMAAKSTNSGVDLNVSVLQSKNIPGVGATGGIPLIQGAGVNGGTNYQGVNIASGGNLNTVSGGATTMQSTQANVGGAATIDAAGGLTKTSTTSGGIDLGFKLGKDSTGAASLDLPSTGNTQVNAKGGTTVSKAAPSPSTASPSLSVQQTQAISKSLTTAVSSAPPALQSSLTSILNNANLSTADKFKKMTAAINNDTSLSQDDKTKMLSALTAQQQSLKTTP